MTSLEHQVDVAVIDEIQLLGDFYRGWAWTRALLGVPAREVSHQSRADGRDGARGERGGLTNRTRRTALAWRQVHVCGDVTVEPLLQRLWRLSANEHPPKARPQRIRGARF